MLAKRNRYIFWQINPSPHQAPFVKALANIEGVEEVILVIQSDITQERLSLGWNIPDYGLTKIIINPDAAILKELIFCKQKNTVQIFSFLSSNKKIKAIFNQCKNTDALIGLLSEGRDWRGIKGYLRLVHGFFNERQFKKHINFVLAIGHLAKKWYSLNGFDEDKLYNFCYVVSENKFSLDERNLFNEKKVVTLTYVGRLLKLKRINIIISALSKTNTNNWELAIIGDGIEKDILSKQISLLGLSHKIKMLGIIKNDDVKEYLSNTDILILSSIWDGWGAVINEALMCGSQVVCSNYCGAADLIVDKQEFGEVFKVDSVNELTDALNKRIVKGSLKYDERKKIVDYSQSFYGVSIAKYLVEIINFVGEVSTQRPKAPWKIE